MRLGSSIRTYLAGSLLYGWALPDRPRIFYYQTKAYLDRFLLKRKSANRIVSVKAGGDVVHFRDNWFDPRSLADVFVNDYNSLDPGIFAGLASFVDVGANAGFISLCARRASPGCRIFCFEPLEGNAALCRLNNPDAVVEQSGIGSRRGKMRLLVDAAGFMASSLRFGYDQSGKDVPLLTLDGYFAGKGIVPDLIKIDVEGMEVEVASGGKKTIQSAKRVIAEVHSRKLLSAFRDVMGSYGLRERACRKVEGEVCISDWINTGGRPRP
jgi:FkbM family methyltransferase